MFRVQHVSDLAKAGEHRKLSPMQQVAPHPVQELPSLTPGAHAVRPLGLDASAAAALGTGVSLDYEAGVEGEMSLEAGPARKGAARVMACGSLAHDEIFDLGQAPMEEFEVA